MSRTSSGERSRPAISRSPVAVARRRHIWTIAKIGVTVLIFAYIAHSGDFSGAWQRVSDQNLLLVAFAAFVFLLQVVIGAARWLIILNALGARLPAWETLKLFYVSVFFNSYVPGGVGGDVVRAWLCSRGGLPAKAAITSVIIDRVAALTGVAILVLLTAPILLARTGTSVTMLLPVVVSIAGLIGILVAVQFERLPPSLLRFPPVRLLHEFSGSLKLAFLRPSTTAPLIAVSVLGQIALGVATYAMALSLRMNVSLLECVVLMQPVALVANLPISVGGWGVRESAMILLFGLVGMPASASLALSVQLGLLLLAVALPGGLIWLAMKPQASPPVSDTLS